MPPPSKLAIATASLNRLVKDEASYTKELQLQESRIAKLEQADQTENENAEYELRQEHKSLQETKDMIPRIRTQIQDALSNLEKQLNDQDGSGQSKPEDVTKAKEAIESASKTVKGSA